MAGFPVRALRVTYVGELGWELPAPIADLARLYAAISAAGQPHGIADFGVQAIYLVDGKAPSRLRIGTDGRTDGRRRSP